MLSIFIDNSDRIWYQGLIAGVCFYFLGVSISSAIGSGGVKAGIRAQPLLLWLGRVAVALGILTFVLSCFALAFWLTQGWINMLFMRDLGQVVRGFP